MNRKYLYSADDAREWIDHYMRIYKYHKHRRTRSSRYMKEYALSKAEKHATKLAELTGWWR